MNIRMWPDPILRQKCVDVPEVTDDIRRTAREMLDCMYVTEGIGLAAPQVGLPIRMFVLDIWWPETGKHDRGLVFINPALTLGKDTARGKEGCLSLPGVGDFIARSTSVHVKAVGLDGQVFEMDADGLLAICIQHENDHLDGITLVERVGPTARRFLKKQLVSSIPPRGTSTSPPPRRS